MMRLPPGPPQGRLARTVMRYGCVGVRAPAGGYARGMPDVTVSRHADRWSVAVRGQDSPVEEHPTRKAAEVAARQLAAGGTVEVIEDDPTGLDENAGGDTTRREGAAESHGPGASEGVRDVQPGL